MRSVRRDEISGTAAVAAAAGERETNETKGGGEWDGGGTVKRETIKCCFFCFCFLISGECDVRRLLCRGRLFGRLRQYLDVCEV